MFPINGNTQHVTFCIPASFNGTVSSGPPVAVCAGASPRCAALCPWLGHLRSHVSRWTLGVFPLFGYYEKCLHEHSYTILCVDLRLHFSVINLAVALPGCMVILCLTSWARLFSKVLHHFTVQPATHEGSSFLHPRQRCPLSGWSEPFPWVWSGLGLHFTDD